MDSLYIEQCVHAFMNKITLKLHWDRQPTLNAEKGYHVTRDDEHQILVDFLERRDEGAMLLCGHCGVGKTSSVIAAIHEVKKRDNQSGMDSTSSTTINHGKSEEHHKPLIPILIKATTLNFSNEKGGAEILLHGLIKFLHKAAQSQPIDNGLQKRTKELYIKSAASQVYEKIRLETTKVSKKTVAIRFVPTSILAALGLLATTTGEALWTYGLLLSAIVYSSVSGTVVEHVSKRTTEDYYMYDYNFSEKIDEFERLMEEYSKDYRVLFVLDEFDKVQGTDKIIRPLKMLINQGHALYIFVTDPGAMDLFTIRRSAEYTLFSQILFLKRPLFQEMETYIDSIVTKIDECRRNPEYRSFRNYLCYKSQTDFFDIKKTMRDYITGTDSGQPVVSIALDSHQLIQANLQKAIGWIYGKKKSSIQSEQPVNDEMLDNLYDAVEKIQNPNGQVAVQHDKNSIQYPSETVEYHPHVLSAIHDLFLVLADQGYLRQDGDCYHINGVMPQFNDKSNVYIEEERLLVSVYENLEKNLIAHANIHSKWLDDMGQPFLPDRADQRYDEIADKAAQYGFNIDNSARECYLEVISSSRKHIPIEKLQNAITGTRYGTSTLEQASALLLAHILEREFEVALTQSGDLSGGLFVRLGIPNRDLHNNSMDLEGKTPNIKNIVVVNSPPTDLLQEIRNKSDSHNNLIICVAAPDYFATRGHIPIKTDVATLRKWFRDISSQKSPDINPESKSPETQNTKHPTLLFGFRTPLTDSTLAEFVMAVKQYFT